MRRPWLQLLLICLLLGAQIAGIAHAAAHAVEGDAVDCELCRQAVDGRSALPPGELAVAVVGQPSPPAAAVVSVLVVPGAAGFHARAPPVLS